jgi:hypothetical protein
MAYHGEFVVKMRKKIVYEAEGQVFETKREAVLCEINAQLRRLMERDGVCQGGEWTADMVRTWMIEAGWALPNLLSAILRHGGAEREKEARDAV